MGISIKYVFACILYIICCINVYAQPISKTQIQVQLDTLIASASISIPDKLQQLQQLKGVYDKNGFIKDSVYALLIERIGFYEFKHNNESPTPASFAYTNQAIQINNAKSKGSAPHLNVKYYTNMAVYYRDAGYHRKAFEYYDSTIMLGVKYASATFVVTAMHNRIAILSKLGDYNKSIEESIAAVAQARIYNNKNYITYYYNQRSQAYYFIGNPSMAAAVADSALAMAISINDTFEIATAYKNKAFAYSDINNAQKAEALFKKVIQLRILTGRYPQLSDDYTDLGNFYFHVKNNYNKAVENYWHAVEYADITNDSLLLAKSYVNLGTAYLKLQNTANAIKYTQYALAYLGLPDGNNILLHANAEALGNITDKELALIAMVNKAELLLTQYKAAGKPQYLQACMQTALVTDSLITKMRHEQTGEQSKLYWRERTRIFFSIAMEACFAAGEKELAFLFMEKSRAVLLNDKLNELGAFAQLPVEELFKERQWKSEIAAEQKKLYKLNQAHPQYTAQQLNISKITSGFERYKRDLEKKYPAYYQYKYADDVVSITDLKKYLAQNNLSFVHYFIADTATYILVITPHDTRFVKLNVLKLNEQMQQFLAMCTNKQLLNNQYNQFASLSYQLYTTLFAPLQLNPGRVAISYDNTLLPFDALTKDKEGRHFLIEDYAFSYVYSARFLLKKFGKKEGHGGFLGMAPVSYAAYLGVPDLKNSNNSIQNIASHYTNKKLFTHTAASRKNFIAYLPNYAVVNIFSHAEADSNGNEPLLYMADSVIRLSELQWMRNPATEMIILSACQTNAGKTASGEGIISLARGFSALGIASVAATLWQADEQAIYDITQQLHKNLASGMRKDDALQQAKLTYMHSGSTEKELPYYWANMILAGNGEPVSFVKDSTNWLLYAGVFIVALLLSVAAIRWMEKSNRI